MSKSIPPLMAWCGDSPFNGWPFTPHSDSETAFDTEPEPPTVTIEQFRSLLQKWVTLDENRHPDFQNKKLQEESKELINKSRK